MGGDQVQTVTELTRDIKACLEGTFARVWVAGELFTFKAHSNGHYYFTLKDDRSQIGAVMFRGRATTLTFRPGEGMGVECFGRVTVYEPQGKYQLVVEAMRPAGQGNLLAALDELKRRLGAEGLFDARHKKPLPFVPRRVGIVTSASGAALRDMLRVLHDRYPVPVLLAPAAVQGAAAAPAIVEGLRALDAVGDVDVIIVGRGGGSLEDLWAFNDERVVRAIFAARTPVVSAVGHEVDFLLSDFVADVRAPTPTAAAEMVVPRWSDLSEALRAMRDRAGRAVGRRLREGRRELELARVRVSDPRRLIEQRAMRVDELAGRAEQALRMDLLRRRGRLDGAAGRLLALHPRQRLGSDRRRLDGAAHRLQRSFEARALEARTRLDRVTTRLHLLGPEESLRRGYAIIRRTGTDEVVRDFETLAPGDALDLTLARGSAGVRVLTTGPDPRPPTPPPDRPVRRRQRDDEAGQGSLF
ncbi:MAG: hypothetical protein AMXMBFR64_61330 [Myxococcales bacterium]